MGYTIMNFLMYMDYNYNAYGLYDVYKLYDA